jgi:hypothetical protein
MTEELTLDFEFTHPATQEYTHVTSYQEVRKVLVPHLLTNEQACEIVGANIVKSTSPEVLMEEMLRNDHGAGANVCAVIHMRSIGILRRAEMHFELCAECGLF